MKLIKLTPLALALLLTACDNDSERGTRQVTVKDFNRADIGVPETPSAPNRDQFGVEVIDLDTNLIEELIEDGHAERITPLTENDLIGVWRLIQRESSHPEWGLSFRQMYLDRGGRVIFFDINEDGENFLPRVWDDKYSYDPETPDKIIFVDTEFTIHAARTKRDRLIVQLDGEREDAKWVQVFRVQKTEFTQ